MFYENSFVVAARARKLSRDEILFSDINWSQFFLLIHFSYKLFFFGGGGVGVGGRGGGCIYIMSSFIITERCFRIKFFLKHNIVAFTSEA